MPSNAPNPTIKIGVEMSPEARQRIEGFVDDLKKRIDQRSKSAGSDDPELKRLREIYDVVKKTAAAQEDVARGGRRWANSLGGVAGYAGMGLRNFATGAGGGGALSPLIGLGTSLLENPFVAAATAFAGIALVLGAAAKAGFQFEQATTRAAQQLSIGGDFGENFRAIRSGAYAGERYGVANADMIQAMQTLGQTSGRSGAEIGANAGEIAKYHAAYGIDPSTIATLIGPILQTTRDTIPQALSAVFGGAEGAGPMGRRLGEFVATATNVLTTLQFQQPTGNFGAQDASSLVRNIARLGGIYGTSAGVQATMAASQSLLSGGADNIRKMAFLAQAHVSPIDIMLERPGAHLENIKAALHQAARWAGNADPNNPLFVSLVREMAGGPQSANMLLGALQRAGGNINAIDRIYNTHTAGAAPVDQRVADYWNTAIGKLEPLWAKAINSWTADGDKMFSWMDRAANDAATSLERVAKAADDLTGANSAATPLPGAAGAGGGGVGALTRWGFGIASKLVGVFGGYGTAQQVGFARSAMLHAGNPHFAYAQALVAAANAAGYDPEMFAAQIAQESGGRPGAVSTAGALGIAQFMPKTAAGYGIDPLNPLQALPAAAKMMASLRKRYGKYAGLFSVAPHLAGVGDDAFWARQKDLELALMAYNWGDGNVDAFLKTGRGMYGQAMPQETRDYLGQIEQRVLQSADADPVGLGSSTTVHTPHGKIKITAQFVGHNKANAGPRVRTHK